MAELTQVGNTYNKPPKYFEIEVPTGSTLAAQVALLPVNVAPGSWAFYQEPPVSAGAKAKLRVFRFRRTSENPAAGSWDEI